MGSRRTWLSRCQQKKNCSHHTAGPVSQRTKAGRQGAHRKAPWLQINFPCKQAKAPTPWSWISTGSIPGSQRLGCGSGLQFPLTEGGHRVCSAAGAVDETPSLCIVSISAHLCYFQTRKGHRDPRETHFPPSLELLFLPRTCFCCHLSLAKRRNKHWGLAELKALACRMGKRRSWSSARGRGSAPRPLPGSPEILVLVPC